MTVLDFVLTAGFVALTAFGMWACWRMARLELDRREAMRVAAYWQSECGENCEIIGKLVMRLRSGGAL